MKIYQLLRITINWFWDNFEKFLMNVHYKFTTVLILILIIKLKLQVWTLVLNKAISEVNKKTTRTRAIYFEQYNLHACLMLNPIMPTCLMCIIPNKFKFLKYSINIKSLFRRFLSFTWRFAMYGNDALSFPYYKSFKGLYVYP